MIELVTLMRAGLILYVMASPFVMIFLQQKLFKSSFDDELGNRLIIRLQMISVFGCIAFYLMSYDWGLALLQSK